ncbi:MAG: Fe-S cluster assembly scaffold protein NifU [Chloroflexota bacterium]
MFSQTVLDHFEFPRNTGAMTDADVSAGAENPVCGDQLKIWLRIVDGRITGVSWNAQGCAPVIAAASITSELLTGMALEKASALTKEYIIEQLGGLPSRKIHAATLVITTIRKAIDVYQAGR